MAEPSGFEVAGIIRSKVTPPFCDGVVPRPRLDGLITDRIQRSRAVLVCATAGSGKTVAVRAAAQRSERPLAWLTVDRSDSAPGRLVSYLEAAISRVAPVVDGRATGAMRMGIQHTEATGLLVDAVGDMPVVLVLDELERLGRSEESWAVVESLMRYAPRTMTIVLVSRRTIPTNLCALPMISDVAFVSDNELAFRPGEAAAVLARHPGRTIDPEAAVEATGGWVTGVLFEAWRSADHVPGTGGEADPLHGYLATHILRELSDEQREFLVTMSLLDEITPEDAHAMGVPDGARLMAGLQLAHIPATWSTERFAVRCHSRFREYLQFLFALRGSEAIRAGRVAHGRILAAGGLYEEAAEVFLKAGAVEEAVPLVEKAILSVVDRLDVGVAERWLAQLSSIPVGATSPLLTAELTMAVGQDDYQRAGRIIDGLVSRGERDRLARSSGRAAAMIAWSYLHRGAAAEVSAVLDVAEPSPEVRAARHAAWIITNPDNEAKPQTPELTDRPTDALILIAELILGRAGRLIDTTGRRWVDWVVTPWRIAALRTTGHTQSALEAYEAAVSTSGRSAVLDVYVGPEVLIDAGEPDRARAALRRGREIALRTGSMGYRVFNLVVEAKLELLLLEDAAAARVLLNSAQDLLSTCEFRHLSEVVDTYYGLSLLLDGSDLDEAIRRLRRAVSGMRSGSRYLDLPAAAIYLAEAEWRAGNEREADAAADVALDAARHNESNHIILQALKQFPGVASRRVDAELHASSEWHELGRALRARRTEVVASGGRVLHIEDFGPPAVMVDGKAVSPSIRKSLELAGYLASSPQWRAARDDVIAALFDGRPAKAALTYYRQTVHHLRLVLPEKEDLVTERGFLRFQENLTVVSDTQRFEARLAEATALRGRDKLLEIVAALSAYSRGEFMQGIKSEWVVGKRNYLQQLAVTAQYEAAELAFSMELLDQARELCDVVLGLNPYHEAAWRLRMKLAGALGDEPAVINAYLDCAQALAHAEVKPAYTTKVLLERLRR